MHGYSQAQPHARGVGGRECALSFGRSEALRGRREPDRHIGVLSDRHMGILACYRTGMWAYRRVFGPACGHIGALSEPA